ncbi:branched-chain amino acid ABC transporter ATPase [Amycolatopsis mediterranei S699]|uniref:ATPase component of ABC-type branched-chain amino acid transport system n=2 Tax=Amycolatopsis mediterranei TaxID=33910 RepID=A0A0H3D7S6_AMYMU|nr:ABC transporter ATP-binding protein [Amycolatopsis mediterranei]ADJ45604.1 ATPase component of ABC-type branched-chain amino acid transport system [Amycolatopsis mediterranei U32]AEK42383.1 branched-chain amino acid ABC transporter ATPase [Amycolatopsis mediterranei S699]AFO77316.1 branched-chain amino acid ABC transporter ATPase [Amycolatopsis mediterranei S699]AGT84444.1 branched-chain amino acid ABC transporter ATPase [Amycolatopsis mediterranei RB]KDO05860.1 ABC transporter [Amycolatops
MTVNSTLDAPALEVEGVSAGYGPTAVLREVSFTVPAGSVVALLGPNGAGKTTVLRAVSGLLPVRSGTIRIAGREVTRERAHRRFARGLCHVPEGRGVFRGLTVRENLVLQAAAGQEDDALERAVAAFPILGRRLGQQAGTLSGGQQQMLAMAAAHVRSPGLVLVDEASLGLAPIIVDEIFEFLRQRADDGAALLIVDQFARRALALASTAYVLRRGRIVHGGPAADLLNSDLFGSYLGGPVA